MKHFPDIWIDAVNHIDIVKSRVIRVNQATFKNKESKLKHEKET